MHGGWGHIFTAAVYACGGFCAGLLLYMRVCNRMPSGRLKRWLGRGALAGLTLAGAAAGAWTGWTPWAWVPVLAMAAFLAAEAATVFRRRRFRAGPPVEIRHGPRRARWLTTFDLRVLRYEIESPWPGTAPLRIGHLSDLHINDSSDRAYLHTVADRLAEAAPDLLVLTGDFVNREPDSRRLGEFLSALRAPLGVFATLGNHDYAVGADGVRAHLAARGIRVLAGAMVEVDAGGGRRLALAGDDAPWGDTRPPGGFRPPAGMPWIGLSHSPDNAFAFARAGAFAVFSGHLHAGQVRFPLLGPAAVPSRNGRCFVHGHYRVDGLHLFVTAGLGSTFPPFRIRCHPDLLLVDLRG